MKRFAICNETYQGWSWPEICRSVSQIGYTGIEIAPFTLHEDIRCFSAAQRAETRRAAEDNGLEITGLHWLLVSPKGLSITTNDSAARQATIDYLLALTDLCADLGGRVMVFGSPAARRIPEGGTEAVAAERFLEGIRPMLDRAHSAGITVCLEPLPPPEADFLLNLATAKQLMDRLAHPAAAAIFDVKSACSEGRELAELYTEYASHIAHIHANDANRRGPGFGDTPFGPLLKAVHTSGYSGWISVEVFDYSPDPVTIARESLRHLAAHWPSS